MQKENYVIDKIEMLRKKRNLSRYRLARRSGLALSSVSNLLNRKNVPTIYTLEKLCAALGVTMAQFFSIDDTRPNLTK
ncbi:MAG: helix-turn-helix transcriptional regulator, partial [Phascolarctobacterium sp.]|nr:helix-turn-helix transcriptional regulator [Phascolarctobacterium sp.]